jgi:hypothetical protein
MKKDSDPNYADLDSVFDEAYSQAAFDKGLIRHVVGEEPYSQQLICWLNRRGYDFCRGQAVKKIDESLRLNPEAAIKELLGAINYLAAGVIVLKEKANGEKSKI